ncbi:28S ribosomal protein S15, mitochondrial isoform X1 [Hippoglossus hippoglossus]|uniref:28S ribosomal protein S15, mitochondrial isoform X1 n=1 Tax=Hippoglossus hippoglossus TaxID=8267 RepID=UPI00148D3CBB|nr:28S ribosomal protein S15, mitochondrial isoform X1 [Hippoglossus hippoglossus]
MFTNVALRTVLKSTAGVLRDFGCAVKPWTCSSALTAAPGGVSAVAGSFALPPPVRHYARGAKTKKTVPQSQLSDLPPTMLRMDYAAVPLVQTTDDVVKRLLSLELACHSDKLQLKKEQLIAKVQRDESDRSSVEVKGELLCFSVAQTFVNSILTKSSFLLSVPSVAILTARIRNYQEHLQKHHKDKANKRRMLMAIDTRKKMLKCLRLVRYDAFEKVCEQLGITYTFPPEYYRRVTRRWLAKKALCIKVFKEVQKRKEEERLKTKQSLASTAAEAAKTNATTH